MSSDGQRIKWLRNIAENFNRLSRVHERYAQTDDRRQTDRQTDERQHIAIAKNWDTNLLFSLVCIVNWR